MSNPSTRSRGYPGPARSRPSPRPQPNSATVPPRVQPRVEVGDLRQPLLDQLPGERGPVEPALGVLHGVVAVGDAAAGAVGGLERGQHPADGLQEAADRDQVGGAVRVQQDGLAAGEQPEAARVGRVLRVVDGQQSRGGLLLAPLPGVAGVDPGGGGQRRRGGGTAVGERAVEAEPRAEGDGGELERAESGLEQPAGQLAGDLLGGAFVAGAASVVVIGCSSGRRPPSGGAHPLGATSGVAVPRRPLQLPAHRPVGLVAAEGPGPHGHPQVPPSSGWTPRCGPAPAGCGCRRPCASVRRPNRPGGPARPAR